MDTPTPDTAPDIIATTLAGFVRQMRLDQIPPAVRLRAKYLMLDAIGCGLAARCDPFAKRFSETSYALAADAPGAASVVGYTRRLPVRDAAMLNGVLLHGLDYDDTHMAGVIHLTVSVLPALLGTAGQFSVSGADLLAAYIAALEAGARLASVMRGGLHAQGFHPTGVIGAFACALAVGRVMGLSAEQLVHAQGAALSFASGSLQFIEDGAWTKRIHPGWAAQSGIVAATLAAHGIQAPQAPYTGRYGLYRIYLDEAARAGLDPTLAIAGLSIDGSAMVWQTANVAVKPYAMCHFVHAAIDAAIVLHRRGVDVASVSDIEVLVPAAAVQLVCEPAGHKRRPENDYDAKFSLPYAVACGLLRGRLGLKELEPAAYRDPQILALMDMVRYVEDADSTFPRHYTGEVRVTLTDGTTLRHREAVNRGHVDKPLSNEDVHEKFMQNATLHFPPAHARALSELILGLDALPSLTGLETLLARDPPDAASARELDVTHA
jgi:2-methylcitrate dehydratase PrpD